MSLDVLSNDTNTLEEEETMSNLDSLIYNKCLQQLTSFMKSSETVDCINIHQFYSVTYVRSDKNFQINHYYHLLQLKVYYFYEISEDKINEPELDVLDLRLIRIDARYYHPDCMNYLETSMNLFEFIMNINKKLNMIKSNRKEIHLLHSLPFWTYEEPIFHTKPSEEMLEHSLRNFLYNDSTTGVIGGIKYISMIDNELHYFHTEISYNSYCSSLQRYCSTETATGTCKTPFRFHSWCMTSEKIDKTTSVIEIAGLFTWEKSIHILTSSETDSKLHPKILEAEDPVWKERNLYKSFISRHKRLQIPSESFPPLIRCYPKKDCQHVQHYPGMPITLHKTIEPYQCNFGKSIYHIKAKAQGTECFCKMPIKNLLTKERKSWVANCDYCNTIMHECIMLGCNHYFSTACQPQDQKWTIKGLFKLHLRSTHKINSKKQKIQN